MTKAAHFAIGIDVGGSGIKGAPVNLKTGKFAAPKKRIPTPQPATPDAVCDVIAELVDHFAHHCPTGPVGVTIPGVVTDGIVRTSANIDASWQGYDARNHLEKLLGREVYVVNDADAAGLAEVRYGAARGQRGLVILTTLGTGIGTALIYHGTLIPNSELGHLEIDGHDAETQAASSVQERLNLSWEEWAGRLQKYYAQLEAVLWPEMFLVGGGVSADSEHFLPLLSLRTPIKPAVLENKAGIIGAAHYAAKEAKAAHRHADKEAKKARQSKAS